LRGSPYGFGVSFIDQSVFVYGTLKPGGRFWPKYCEGKVAAVVPARIQGELYDLHLGYPGLLLRGEDWVRGFILSFPEAADFAEVDRLEGYSPTRPPERNEYDRVRVDCFDAEGRPLGRVWVYAMTEERLRRLGATRLCGGDWPVAPQA